jgi:23S rRNA (uracil1939-C5)-methyltransferase
MVPSSIRIAPKCVHFGVCGGCRWQQMSYDEQLKEKERILRKCFHDILQTGVDLRPIIPCEPVWQYRNKMEYTFSSDLQKNKFLGLVMDGGKGRVLNLTECHLVNPWYTTTLEAVREWWNKSDIEAYHPFSNLGSLRTLTLREAVSSGDRMVVLTVSGNPDYAIHKSDLEDFVRYIRKVAEPADPEKKLSVFLRIQQLAKGMQPTFFEMLLYGPDHIREELEVSINDENQPSKLMFHISPSAFFQPNSYQAQKLYSYALRMAELKKETLSMTSIVVRERLVFALHVV